jgi:hypothetical protein
VVADSLVDTSTCAVRHGPAGTSVDDEESCPEQAVSRQARTTRTVVGRRGPTTGAQAGCAPRL